mmetsp:Transcript_111175/g.321370  ORF Transcript_111175/g.321370 Transcript_111175/m.321370 type:complete len:230 (+) Transcript_111175:898-1587(+)
MACLLHARPAQLCGPPCVLCVGQILFHRIHFLEQLALLLLQRLRLGLAAVGLPSSRLGLVRCAPAQGRLRGLLRHVRLAAQRLQALADLEGTATAQRRVGLGLVLIEHAALHRHRLLLPPAVVMAIAKAPCRWRHGRGGRLRPGSGASTTATPTYWRDLVVLLVAAELEEGVADLESEGAVEVPAPAAARRIGGRGAGVARGARATGLGSIVQAQFLWRDSVHSPSARR